MGKDEIDAWIALSIPKHEWELGALLTWHINRIMRYGAKIHPALDVIGSPAYQWNTLHQDLIQLRWKSERRKLRKSMHC